MSSKMQGREQTPGDLMALKMQRTFYPDGSAYRSETGGLMAKLRELTAEASTSVRTRRLKCSRRVLVRQYHGSYYVPHNLCLIVSGRLKTQDLLDVLQNEVEPTLLKHGQTGAPEGWKRPYEHDIFASVNLSADTLCT